MTLVSEQAEVIVVGGGQAGLTAGYYLTQANIPFVILHADPRVGDSWRARWDSLTLFTPAVYSGLPGLPFLATLSITQARTPSPTTSSNTPRGSSCRSDTTAA
jgi:cation diffusion facilitator CzcD-associated flavoprotein CzcO